MQEGGYPKQTGNLFQLLREDSTWWPAAGNLVRAEVDRELRRAVASDQSREVEETATSAVFLAMGRDRANGQIELHPVTKLLRIRWDLADNLPLYGAEDRLVRDVVAELGGKPANSPFWAKLSQPVSVHNLGGCCMADDAEHGVVDGSGQVFGYRNLFVIDGACLPSATGVNPSHTIAAVAEKNVEGFVRAWLKDPTWVPPERALARSVIDPLSRVQIPEGGTAPTRERPVGMAFRETMAGFLSPADREPADLAAYVAAARAGRQAGAQARLTLTIAVADLDRFLVDRLHAAAATGELRADPLTGGPPAAITNGVFNLFAAGEATRGRKMVYSLPFVGSDGKPYLLDGFKEDADDGPWRVWPAARTLYAVLRLGKTHDAPVCAVGVLRDSIPAFVRQVTSVRFPGAPGTRARIEALGRLGKMFLGIR